MIQITTLGYLASPDRKRLLMVYHNASPANVSYGRLNGFSSLLGPRESISECMRRAVQEEAGLTIKEMQFRGTIHWARFGGGSLVGHVFLITQVEERLPSIEDIVHTPSGDVRWVLTEDLTHGNVPCWEGDRQIVPLVIDNDARPFHGYMPYQKGLVQRGFFERC